MSQAPPIPATVFWIMPEKQPFLYILSLCFAYNRTEHFVRHCACKKHQKIWRTDIFHTARHFCKYLCFAGIFTAKLLVSSFHTFVTAYYYNAHVKLPFSRLAYANYNLKLKCPDRHFRLYIIKRTEPFPLRMERKRLLKDRIRADLSYF